MVLTRRRLKKKQNRLIKRRKNTRRNKRGGMIGYRQQPKTKTDSSNRQPDNQLPETKVNRLPGTAMNIALGNSFLDASSTKTLRGLNTGFQSETPFKLKNPNEIGSIQPKDWDSLITVLERGCIKKKGGYEIGSTIEQVDLSNKHITIAQIAQLFLVLEMCPTIKILKLNKSRIFDVFSDYPLPQSLTVLSLNNNFINDVSLFQHLTNLKELHIRKNFVRDIGSLKNLVSLTTLQLGWNNIVNIEPIAMLVNLTTLELKKNLIADITPLSGLVNLTSLDINNNRLINIEPLEGLINLTDLNLNYNQIVSVEPLNKLINLKQLLLVHNRINDIRPLQGLINLLELMLSDNQINDIRPLHQMTTLVKLDLSYNRRIVNIEPLNSLTNLAALTLNNTGIINIGPLGGLANLVDLTLNNTEIVNIEPLNGLTNLAALTLNNTGIINIGPLGGLTNLMKLTLNHTNITDIEPLRSLINITSLSIDNNQIVNIGPLQRLSNLTDLNLGDYSLHNAFQDAIRCVDNHDYYVYGTHPPTIDDPNPNIIVRRHAELGDYKHIGTRENIKKGREIFGDLDGRTSQVRRDNFENLSSGNRAQLSQENLAILHGEVSFNKICQGLRHINDLKSFHDELLDVERDIPDNDKTAKKMNGFRLYRDPSSTQWKSLGNYDFKNRDAELKRRIGPHPEGIKRTLKRGGKPKRKKYRRKKTHRR